MKQKFISALRSDNCAQCTTDSHCSSSLNLKCDKIISKCGCMAGWSDSDGISSNGCESNTPGTPEVANCPFRNDYFTIYAMMLLSIIGENFEMFEKYQNYGKISKLGKIFKTGWKCEK